MSLKERCVLQWSGKKWERGEREREREREKIAIKAGNTKVAVFSR